MNPETVGVIGLVVLVVLLFARMWIGAAMALVGFLGYAYIMGLKPALAVVAQIPFSTIAWYPMSTVPLFIFMGVILFNSGVGAALYDTAYRWIGQLRGGLAMSTVLACALFAAITGVSAPAVVTMGKVAVPEMRKRNYDDKLATGSIACAGTLAFLIPPSMAFIIYGILTETSIGLLFMAGLIPGILLALLFVLTIMIITTLRPGAGPAGPKFSFKDKIISLKGTWHTLLLFLIVLGGIYGGIFTPTEAGAVGVFLTLVITAVAGRLTWTGIVKSMRETLKISCFVFVLVTGAIIFGRFLAVTRLPFMIADFAAGLPVSPYIVLALILTIYLVGGCFMDSLGFLVLTIPIFFPLGIALGFDPIWFSIIITMVTTMGAITPPVGVNIYVVKALVPDVPLETIFKSVSFFLVACLISIIILIVFPQIVLIIPQMAY